MIEPSEIIRRLDAGETPATIAKSLNISVRRVYQLRGVKSERRKIDDPLIEEVRALYSSGVSQRQIVVDLKMSRRTVSEIVKDLDILPKPTNAGKLSNDVIAHILSRHRAGRAVATIAKELEIEPSAVRGVIKRNADDRFAPEDTIMRAIAAEMARRGMTAGQLCQEMGEPPTREYLYSILRGDQTPTTVIASRLLKFLGIKLSA